MKPVTLILLAVLLVAPATGDEKSKANFTISKETTYVLGPLDKDGRIDYSAALNERMGKGVTAETNANVLLWQVFGPKPEGGGQPAGFFKLMGMEAPPEEGDYFVDIWKFLKEQLAIEDQELIEDILEQLTAASRYPWSAKKHPYLADWLKSSEKPLALAIEATKRKHYFAPLMSSESGSGCLISALLPAAQKCRSLATVLNCRAMLRLHEGKYDEAWQDLLACHRLARHVATGGTLIEALVGFAIENLTQRAELSLLDCPEIDSKRLLGFLRDFQALPAMPTVADRIDLGERHTFLDCIMFIDRKGLTFLRQLELGDLPEDVPVPTGPLVGINWDPALKSVNRYYDTLIAALREPDRENREKELEKVDTDLQDRKKRLAASEDFGKAIAGVGITPEERGKILGEAMMTVLTSNVRRISTSFDRCEQGQRNMRLGFALAAFQRDNKRYPKSLDELAPKYLKTIPNDLFTGKPLIYKPYEKGFLLYSFGPNGQDDEGRWYDDEPRGDDPNVRIPVVRK